MIIIETIHYLALDKKIANLDFSSLSMLYTRKLFLRFIRYLAEWRRHSTNATGTITLL